MTNNILPLKSDSNDSLQNKTILIFGISSFIGSNLADFLKNDYRIIGTYYLSPIQIPGILTLPCDVLNKDSIQLAMLIFKPEITIYSVGISSLIESDKIALADEELNSKGLFNVLEACQRYRSQLCYFSSAYVFHGNNHHYSEMDIPNPSTVYGRSQVSAELYIQKTSFNYIILRCCKLYGRGLSMIKKNWFEIIERNLVQNKNIHIDSYVQIGFLDIHYLSMILKIIFKKEIKNKLFHINTQDIMSHYDFSKLYAKIFGFSKNSLSRSMWQFPNSTTFNLTKPQKDKYFHMETNNIENILKISMPSIEESLNYSLQRLNGLGTKNYSKNKFIEYI